jgi:hypothetical protein
MRALGAELGFERGNEDLEKVERQRVRVAPEVSLMASSTIELNTIGGFGSRADVSLICSITAAIFSGESTKGIVSRVNSISSNCDSRLLPSISAVIPVRSETKKTVRRTAMP